MKVTNNLKLKNPKFLFSSKIDGKFFIFLILLSKIRLHKALFILGHISLLAAVNKHFWVYLYSVKSLYMLPPHHNIVNNTLWRVWCFSRSPSSEFYTVLNLLRRIFDNCLLYCYKKKYIYWSLPPLSTGTRTLSFSLPILLAIWHSLSFVLPNSYTLTSSFPTFKIRFWRLYT